MLNKSKYNSCVEIDYYKLIEKIKSLVSSIKNLGNSLPPIESYNLMDQMFRCTDSLSEKHFGIDISNKKQIHNIDIAVGSCGELKCYFDLCLDCEYVKKEVYDNLDIITDEVVELFYDFKVILNAQSVLIDG